MEALVCFPQFSAKIGWALGLDPQCVKQWQRPPADAVSVREFPVSPTETIRAALIAALAVRFGKSLIILLPLPPRPAALPHLGVGVG